MSYIQQIGAPVVIKADGLAAGKGVTVCATVAEAERAITESLIDITFGKAGSRILVEEFLEGEEVSILALIDGEHVVMLPSAQDHKRVFDNDKGPNTGGMGAYSPAPVATPELLRVIETEVFGKLLVELKKRNIVYRGVLYAGLMITKSSVKVLEFNCRFGDPEIQAILPRFDCDLIPALEACIDGTLTPDLIKWKPEACVCIVMASGGYPGSYEKGKPIVGIDKAEKLEGVTVFHAGTKLQNGKIVTSGGRVLGVTGRGNSIKEAINTTYQAVGKINFDGMHYRRDIGKRAI
jgi:phosphoribosylamine--glycine ligase